MTTTRQWILARPPGHRLSVDDFTLQEVHQRPRQAGGVLCRTLWLSIDAAGRAWMQGRTYRKQVVAGDVMPGFGIAEVVESDTPGLAPGTLVTGDLGWRDQVAMPAAELQVLIPTVALPTVVMDYADRYDEALAQLTAWLEDGSLRASEDVLDGIESAPQGLVGLLAGDRVGKRLIHVDDPTVVAG